MHRRQFLPYLGLASASALWLRTSPAAAAAKQRQEKVIVIGAGMAGMAAAWHLREAGLAPIVLEGRERLGGRIHTDNRLGVAVDLGASWIHGLSGNPIASLADKAGVKTKVTDYDAVDYFSAGRQGKGLSGAEWKDLGKILRLYLKALEDAKEVAGAGDGMQEITTGFLKSLSISELEMATLQWSIRSEICLEYGEDLDKLSLSRFDENEAFAGDDAQFPGGYSQLIDFLAKGTDVRLSHTVRSIAWDDDGVRVDTDRGEFQAARVIVTLPLGVLKAGKVRFNPGLPKPKLDALERTSMGALNKIVLAFDKAFWPEDLHYFGCPTQKGEAVDFFSQIPVNGQPNLMALVAGDFSRGLERGSAEEATGVMLATLRAAFGKKSVSEPRATLRSTWTTDPFSLGAYSVAPPGARESDIDKLAESVDGRIFFAGEATHNRYPATVHGAYLSGRREARAVLEAAE